MTTATAPEVHTVTVYLNEGPDHFDGFKPGHLATGYGRWVQAIKYLDTPTFAGDFDEILNRAFDTFNFQGTHHSSETLASAYMLGGHRSLSVGDVVVIDEEVFTVERFGWKRRTSAVHHFIRKFV